MLLHINSKFVCETKTKRRFVLMSWPNYPYPKDEQAGKQSWFIVEMSSDEQPVVRFPVYDERAGLNFIKDPDRILSKVERACWGDGGTLADKVRSSTGHADASVAPPMPKAKRRSKVSLDEWTPPVHKPKVSDVEPEPVKSKPKRVGDLLADEINKGKAGD